MSTDDSGTGSNGAPVVVGFDDSPGGRAALRHAWDEARLRSAPLQVVTAFDSPRRSGFAYGVSFLPDEAFLSQDPTAPTVRDRARRRVDEVLADLAGAGSPVVVSAVAGPTVQVLLDRSREAALLVVGNRGHGAVTSAMLGSVGLNCVLHASCPVTVVPTPGDDDPQQGARAPYSRAGDEPAPTPSITRP